MGVLFIILFIILMFADGAMETNQVSQHKYMKHEDSPMNTCLRLPVVDAV